MTGIDSFTACCRLQHNPAPQRDMLASAALTIYNAADTEFPIFKDLR